MNGLGMTGTGHTYQTGPSIIYQDHFSSHQPNSGIKQSVSPSEASGSRLPSRVPEINLNFGGGLIWPE